MDGCSNGWMDRWKRPIRVFSRKKRYEGWEVLNMESVTPVFLSYLNCITNHSLKNLLNLFRRSSSRSPPPDFSPSRHHAVSSSFSMEPPVPFPFPPAPPSRRITIVSRSAACACPAVIVDAARVSPLFFSHILFKSILFLSSNFFSYFVQIHFISLF
jgi:hypothetical protein